MVLVALVHTNSSADMPTDHFLWAEPVFRGAYKVIATDHEYKVLDTVPKAGLSHYLKFFWKRRDHNIYP